MIYANSFYLKEKWTFVTLKKKKNLFQHSHHQLYLKLIKVSEFKNHIYHKLHAWVKKKSLTFNIKI